MIEKQEILEAIETTAKRNGGQPLGVRRFEQETGIRKGDWLGEFWARWGDALVEAGYEPNELVQARDDDDVLGELSRFVTELGRIPVSNEIRMRARHEATFPHHNTIGRLGRKREWVSKLESFARQHGDELVAEICRVELLKFESKESETVEGPEHVPTDVEGWVYLMKSGKYYKIGRTNSVDRRRNEIRLELPEEVTLIHQIRTDDPSGIEAYLQRRFHSFRANGEWFKLTVKEIRAFKRRKFMQKPMRGKFPPHPLCD
ncbi:MAG: GIY-YIG nuclease family protein [Planctomycetota bacterium]